MKLAESELRPLQQDSTSQNLKLLYHALQEDSLQKQEKRTSSIEQDGTSALLTLGFTKDQAERALKITQGNVERAANWLLQ